MDRVLRLNLRAWTLGTLLALFGVIQFTPGAGVAPAQAQSYPNCGASTNNVITCATIEAAYKACMARKAEVNGWGCTYNPGSFFLCQMTDGGATCGGGASGGYKWSTVCPTGSTWVGSPAFICWSTQRCQARAAYSDGATANLSYASKRCDDGCEAEYQGGTIQTLTTGAGAVVKVGTGGAWKATGPACAAGDVIADSTSDPPTQTCLTDSATGKTLCVNNAGRNCYKLSSMARQICWDATETGEKTDGTALQKRNAGTMPETPTTTPPAGETLQQTGQPLTTSNEHKNQATNTTTTITTTLTEYHTTNGTNLGGTDSGEPDDGSGNTGSGGSGGSDGEGTDLTETNTLLGGIKDKVSDLVDGLKGDGADHSADGALPGDTNVWGEEEVVDASVLDTSGMAGGEGACPPPWGVTPDGEMSSAFLIEAPQQWCDFVSNIKTILILFSIAGGIVLVWKG